MRSYRFFSLVTILGIIGTGCGIPYQQPNKNEYREIRIQLFNDITDCYDQYNEGPFFENFPCDDDIFPNENRDWVELE